MPCYRPLKGYRSPGGQIKFGRAGAWVDLPTTVSCGQCIGCRMNNTLSWSARIMHQTKMEESSCFLTLTYDDDHLPQDQSLDVAHVQKFIKALRKKTKPFKYFLAGEYGDDTFRPHYHLCIMGEDFESDREHYTNTKNGDSLYKSPKVDKTWGKGSHNLIGDLTQQSARYVASYVNKKWRGPTAHLKYNVLFIEKDGTAKIHKLKPEFATMSRRPGLGSTWFEKYHTDVYPSDEVIINGVPNRPPAYYDTLLERHDPKLHHEIKKERIRKGNSHLEDTTAERLAVREMLALRKQGPVTRDIQWHY